jgi:hypothetical protein
LYNVAHGVRPGHEILEHPLHVRHQDGRLTVLKDVAKDQGGMGEALTLDGIVNSIDAELVAMGISGKGPNRGAILRHGRYTLWAFEGGVEDMTEEGQSLFVNTVFYAARHAHSPVLEKRLNGTRDDPYTYLRPGLVETLKSLYLPPELSRQDIAGVRAWLIENRPYLRVNGRRYEVDALAKAAGIPSHRRAILEYCIANLRANKNAEASLATLVRYTGCKELGASADAWRTWYNENRDYLFFSDSEGFRFKIDEEAKAKKVPVERLRNWSSEDIDYRNPENSDSEKH